MELSVPQPRGYSVREYFRLAEASSTKLEYKAGRIIEMAGASYDHNRIAANALGEVRSRLKGGACEATGSDTRVKTSDDRYTYPDVVVVCGQVTFDPLDPGRTITNPKVLFEVLSPATEAMDRGEKFFHYIRLPSMSEYFLVSQVKPRIESFVRQGDGSWSVGPVTEGLDASLVISSLQIVVPMAEIYANIRFESASAVQADTPTNQA